MEAFIKSPTTFRAIAQKTVVDYSITLDSLGGESSSVTLLGDDIPSNVNRSWLVLDGRLFFITQVTPGSGETKLTVADATEVFNRQMLYDGTTAASIGAWLAEKITSGWKNQPDNVYATPYMQITNNDNTAFVAPETDDDGVFNFLEYIRKMRRDHGVVIQTAISGNTLRIIITNDSRATRYLVLDDGHTKLVSSSFSQSAVAKITVIQPVDTGNVDESGDPVFAPTSTDWYLLADGTASTTPPSNRISGDWITVVLGQSDIQSERVMEEFAKNGESHKLEFYSDAALSVNDQFRVNLSGDVFEGTVVAAYRTMHDTRTLFKSGELITTIQERARAGATSSPVTRVYAVGDIFTTTRDGNPSTLLGYGAWVQIRATTVGGHSVRDWLRKE